MAGYPVHRRASASDHTEAARRRARLGRASRLTVDRPGVEAVAEITASLEFRVGEAEQYPRRAGADDSHPLPGDSVGSAGRARGSTRGKHTRKHLERQRRPRIAE